MTCNDPSCEPCAYARRHCWRNQLEVDRALDEILAELDRAMAPKPTPPEQPFDADAALRSCVMPWWRVLAGVGR